MCQLLFGVTELYRSTGARITREAEAAKENKHIFRVL